MFESIINFFKKIGKQEKETVKSKDAAKERLHLVLMQDRANVSADFLDLMKQEIIEVIKKYIDVDENAIDVRLTNKTNGDGTNGAPALYANIPIMSIKEDVKRVAKPNEIAEENKQETSKEETIEPQIDNSEEEQKTEEDRQGEQSSETQVYENVNEVNNTNSDEQKTCENTEQVNSTNPNEQRIYENVGQGNSTTSNEQRIYENTNQVNSNNLNESKTYENVEQENTIISNEQRTYENVNQENKIRQEPIKQEMQEPTENKEHVTGNYTRTF